MKRYFQKDKEGNTLRIGFVKKSKPRTQHSFDVEHMQLEYNTQASLTIPDQAFTPLEILTRYEANIPPELIRVPVYYGGDIFVPDVRTMDLIELQEMERQAEARKQDLKQVYADRLREIDKQAQEKRALKEAEIAKQAEKKAQEEAKKASTT